MENKDFISEVDYERSRRLFILEGVMATGVSTLITGAFIAGLAGFLGAMDGTNGIIAAIPTLTMFTQIIGAYICERLEKRKKVIFIVAASSRFLCGIMFFIPLFFSENKTLGIALLTIFYFIANALVNIGNPAASNWIVDIVPESLRSHYFATREAFMIAFMTIISLFIGFVMDYFKETNPIFGYSIIGVVILVMFVVNAICLASIEEPRVKVTDNNVKLSYIIIKPLRNERYRKYILFGVFWNIGLMFAAPFFSVYQITRLNFNYTYIMIVGFIANVIRVFIIPYWGRFAQFKGFKLTAMLSILLIGISHFSWGFIDNRTAVIMFPLFCILGSIGWGGINFSLFNIQVNCMPLENRSIYFSLNSAFAGLLGFVSTIVGSFLLSSLNGVRVKFLFFDFSDMQILFIVSGLIICLCSVYFHIAIKEE